MMGRFPHLARYESPEALSEDRWGGLLVVAVAFPVFWFPWWAVVALGAVACVLTGGLSFRGRRRAQADSNG